MEEIWKEACGFSKYEVSYFGRIRNRSTKIVLCQSLTGLYHYVHLQTDDGKHCRKSVHRLVAKTFIPNPDNLPQINHKDENPGNNCADNLEWCTISYNAKYGNRNRKMLSARIKNNGPKRERPVFGIKGGEYFYFASITEASRKTGVDFSNISKCCRENCYNKTAGGYIWKYAE